jgi:hypothetical protein
MNSAKKISGWILAVLLVALIIFPDWSGGEYFRLNVLLAAFGTLMLWVSLVLLFSWVFSVCGSLTRQARKNHRRSSVQWRRDGTPRIALPIT